MSLIAADHLINMGVASQAAQHKRARSPAASAEQLNYDILSINPTHK